MSQPDFKTLPLDDLLKMKQTVEAYIDKRLQAKKREALSQIEQVVRDYDLDFDEVVQVIRTRTKRGKAPAVYRNPTNPRQTWSGKGGAPEWFRTAPDPESLRIPGS